MHWTALMLAGGVCAALGMADRTLLARGACRRGADPTGCAPMLVWDEPACRKPMPACDDYDYFLPYLPRSYDVFGWIWFNFG